MTALYVFISIILLLFLLIFLVYLRAFHSPFPGQDNIHSIPFTSQYKPYRATMLGLIQDLESRPYEDVYISSYDGLKLRGRYYHHADGAPLDIAFHGYRGTAPRDMCGGFQISCKAGHNVLLVDQRAHGKSGGHCICFGIKERHDCLSWIEYARERFGADVPILLYGVSMGASTVLMASGMDPGSNVRGIVADSPYSSPKEIIKKVCRDMKLPPRFTYPLIAAAARIFGNFSLTETTAEAAVRNSRIPTLIIHGEDDRFVPKEMSQIIAGSRPDIRRCTFPEAGHGISGIVHMESYNETVLRFINDCFK